MGLKSIISTSHLSVAYGDKVAVEDVSLEFESREVSALIGPSGCGKSTFLRALNRMNDFLDDVRTSGQVIFHGQNIYDSKIDPVLVRRRIGMVFQKPNPFPKSIYENVAWAVRKFGFKENEVRERVEVALKGAALWAEVKDRLKSSAFELSGGQQQRLCIARAMALGPEVILMDEPCSALDPIATAKIEDLIAELKEQFCIIVVTHNMQQAERISDRTVFFLNGKVIESEATSHIFNRPREELTKNYLTGRFG
ncbi:MAG: phosphate ABC transporter ATP-binding protein [Deltaproteobacteria bacterium CG11_big_fil_rev_8_21_14_0_20_45_16]|nr:MAG: phosphate ABC transporter ATP-binding protein [Deltaproteobacteria bacterium CG11_big_fil_rev_8_21_14_0_20_45_16]